MMSTSGGLWSVENLLKQFSKWLTVNGEDVELVVVVDVVVVLVTVVLVVCRKGAK